MISGGSHGSSQTLEQETWEVDTFDELKARLRDKYPDAAFERTLHYLRDYETEERRERALDALMNIIVESMVDDLIAEESRVGVGQRPTPNRE